MWASDCEGLVPIGDQTKFRCMEEKDHVHSFEIVEPFRNWRDVITSYYVKCKCGMDAYASKEEIGEVK